MSAMRAMPLPEDDPDRQAAAICRFHDRRLGIHVVHGPAPASDTAPAAQITATAAPVRLTRRGRAVVAAAAVLLVVVVSLIATSAAQATSHSLPSRGAGQNLSQIVVRPGQTLWSVAQSADPDADTRVVIQQIVELNGLTGDVVQAGQRLWVPRG